MTRRLDELKGERIVHTLEAMTGKTVSEEISAGADELALVRSGLDDIMRTAYQEISAAFHCEKEINDFRTTGFVVALLKIVRTYSEMGR